MDALTNPMASISERVTALRLRYLRPEELLPSDWPVKLRRKNGKARLAHLPVYYDFSWDDTFGHSRMTFPKGQSLAELVKKDCPEDKYPALLLTSRDDVDECPIITETHFIVVVQINNYLSQSVADSATSYFARLTKIQITGLSKLKDVLSTPEGIQEVLPLLSGDAIKNWATGNPDALQQLAEITASSGFGELLTVLTVEDMTRVLDWIIEDANKGQAAEIINRIREASLPKLYTLTGIARITNALQVWHENTGNADEEFWQDTLKQNTFILSQIFSFPVIILKEKAYVGGKGIENIGGNLVDFMLSTELTKNALLVELKTPKTPLLGARYRGDIYNVSTDISGAVQQCSNYKHNILQEYHTLNSKSEQKFNAFNPQSLVIAGNTSELIDEDRKKAFELYRRGLRDIQIITYDELFAKLRTLADLLQGDFDTSDNEPELKTFPA